MNGFWNGRRALVTGAGGFIGSHLVEALLRRGAKVRAFIRYTSRNDLALLELLSPEDLSKIEIVAGDLRDEHAVYQAVKGCDFVFHLGALISIPYSYVHPAEAASVNFMGTLNVLMACREHGVERLAHTSTSEVYGTARRAPIDETHPLQGQSPYSASKIGADKLVESFVASYGLPAVTVRPFNTFGPRQSARAVIPTIVTQALVKDEIKLGNLTATRDFTFVSDTVNGFLRAAEAQGVEGDVFNLGTGEEITIGDLAKRIMDRLGKSLPVVEDSPRLRPEASEVMRLLSDNSLAIRRLGWKPEVALDEGLDRTIAWVRQNLDRYRVGEYEF
ncbi:NAD-dependent epimerase/dehydratase family protein [Chloroflexi bacterium CFX6]|nr:NAD-dependent epimerase/dehydratase family protein [Chloroflexi bacterium CFX6]